MDTDFHKAPTESPSAPTYSTAGSNSLSTPRDDQPTSFPPFSDDDKKDFDEKLFKKSHGYDLLEEDDRLEELL
jgi:hypothetical protein